MKGGKKKRKKYQTRLGGRGKSGQAMQGGSGNKKAVAGQFKTQPVSKPVSKTSASKPAPKSKGK